MSFISVYLLVVSDDEQCLLKLVLACVRACSLLQISRARYVPLGPLRCDPAGSAKE